MRIGYFADGPWAHKALEMILHSKKFEIAFICTRFDTLDPILRKMGEVNSIRVISHPNVNSEEFLRQLRDYDCELLVSMSFNQIFKKAILASSPLGIVNCHAGKLPFYRGRNILNWALINDEKEFGITVHYVDEGIDTGDIILQRTYPITEQDTYSSLLEIAQVECASLLFEALQLIKEGKAQRIQQSSIHPHGFYCSRRIEGDEKLNWNQSSRNVFNFIRAITHPGPCATTSLNGDSVRIGKSRYFPDAITYKGIPGSILAKTKDGYLIKTADTYVEILNIKCNTKLKVGDRLI